MARRKASTLRKALRLCALDDVGHVVDGAGQPSLLLLQNGQVLFSDGTGNLGDAARRSADELLCSTSATWCVAVALWADMWSAHRVWQR